MEREKEAPFFRESCKNFPRKLDKVLIGCYLTLTEDTGETCARELSITMGERAACCVPTGPVLTTRRLSYVITCRGVEL